MDAAIDVFNGVIYDLMDEFRFESTVGHQRIGIDRAAGQAGRQDADQGIRPAHRQGRDRRDAVRRR